MLGCSVLALVLALVAMANPGLFVGNIQVDGGVAVSGKIGICSSELLGLSTFNDCSLDFADDSACTDAIQSKCKAMKASASIIRCVSGFASDAARETQALLAHTH